MALPGTLALPAAHQPMALWAEAAVGAVDVDTVATNAGRGEVTLVDVCGGQQGWRTSRPGPMQPGMEPQVSLYPPALLLCPTGVCMEREGSGVTGPLTLTATPVP